MKIGIAVRGNKMSEYNELEALLEDLRSLDKNPSEENFKELAYKLFFLVYTEGVHIIKLEKEVEQIKAQLSKK
jgi:hypothetical protein